MARRRRRPGQPHGRDAAARRGRALGLELAPGDEHASEAHSPGTQELIHVLAGRVDLVVGAERISLSTGDAVSFPGDVPHQYANIAAAPARFALAVFQPSVGVPRRTADR